MPRKKAAAPKKPAPPPDPVIVEMNRMEAKLGVDFRILIADISGLSAKIARVEEAAHLLPRIEEALKQISARLPKPELAQELAITQAHILYSSERLEAHMQSLAEFKDPFKASEMQLERFTAAFDRMSTRVAESQLLVQDLARLLRRVTIHSEPLNKREIEAWDDYLTDLVNLPRPHRPKDGYVEELPRNPGRRG